MRDVDQTVTQVFGSACSVTYSRNPQHLWAPFAKLVLEASYEATLLAAAETALRHGGEGGSKRVYLTALGGGVFGNDMQVSSRGGSVVSLCRCVVYMCVVVRNR